MGRIIYDESVSVLRNKGALETTVAIPSNIAAALTADNLWTYAIPLVSETHMAEIVSVTLDWSAITGTLPALYMSFFVIADGVTYNAATGAASAILDDNIARAREATGVASMADELSQTLDTATALDQTIGIFSMALAAERAPTTMGAPWGIVRLARQSGTWTTATLKSMRIIVSG